MKTLMEFFVLIAGIYLLAACTKTEDKFVNSGPNVLTIDLTSPVYSALSEAGGSVVFREEGIIVGRTYYDSPNQTFVAADYKCPCCDMQICFTTSNATYDAWVCNCCQVKWDSYGCVTCGVSNMSLETHPVSQSDDILTISF